MSAPAYRTGHARNASLATHRHRGAYATLVLDGDYLESSLDGPLLCRPGTVVVHPAFHAHGDRFGQCGARTLNIELPGALASALAAAASDPTPADAGLGARTEAGPGAGAGFGAGLGPAFGARAWRVPALAEAAEVLDRAPAQLAALLAQSRPLAPAAVPDWQAELLRLIDREDADIGVLAQRLGVSAEHASRTLARSFGMPPRALRRELRWRRALRLLGACLPLAEVAAAAGFADQSHLHRVVRAHAGCTPLQLRRQIKCVQDSVAGRAA